MLLFCSTGRPCLGILLGCLRKTQLWSGLLPKAIQNIQTESVLNLLARTQIDKKWFWSWNKIPGNWKIQKYKVRTNQRQRCEMRVEKNRLRSGYECCCCCCCSAAVCDICCTAISHAKAVNRRHRGAMCSVCVGRAVWCACVAPKPKARQFFSLTGRVCSRKRTAHRAPASACCSSRQSTRRCHRCCICTLPTLLRMTLPALAAASMAVRRRHRGAMGSVWVGPGAVARSRGIGWRSGLAAVFGVYCNRHVFRDSFEHYYYYFSRGALYNKDKERQLWDRGFRRKSSLQAVWDTSIARTTSFIWPHEGC